MNCVSLNSEQLKRVRSVLLRFFRLHGDGRITHVALRWFKELSPHQLSDDTCVIVALEKRRIVGVVVFGNYGLTEAFTAVHQDYRSKGVGELLLKEALKRMDRVYTRVATDNIPSLKLCFRCGLVAFALIQGPTKKPTLVLGGGNFTPLEFNTMSVQKQ